MELPTLQPLDYETDNGFGSRARIGLIVLESDQTIEVDARRFASDDVAFYHSRIPNDDEVTPTTLTDMARRLPAAAALLPPVFEFDAIGYGCTSAATLIGPDGVAAAINQAHPEVPASNPITAALAAFSALQATSVAIVTPYTADVTGPVADQFRAGGYEVPAVGSFLQSSDLLVARITEQSIADAVRSMAESAPTCDAVFVSCTSLRTLRVIPEVEAEIGRPVVSSNQALLWHLLRLAGVDDVLPERGRLFERGLRA